MSTYTNTIAKLFVPADALKNALTILPSHYHLQSGKPFVLHDKTYYSIPNGAMEFVSDLASKSKLKDKLQYKHSDELIKSFREQYKLILSKRILGNNDSLDILNNSDNKQSNSDENFMEFLTCGTGVLLVEKNEEDFKVDVNHLFTYPVRDGFIKYGGKVVFSKDKLITLEYNGKVINSNHTDWDYFKFIIKSSIIAEAIIRIHACQFHIKHSIVAQAISKLNSKNKIYELMAPFLYKNLDSSEAAKVILLGEGRYFHRLFAFTYEGLDNLVKDSLKKSFTVDLSIRLPFHQDAKLMADFFNEFIMEYDISKEDVEEFNGIVDDKTTNIYYLLYNYLFDCTVCHEVVGNTILKWQYNPLCSAAKLVAHSTVSDVQSYEQTMLIGIGTVMNKVPMLMDVVSDEYKEKLVRISEVIRERK